MTSAGSVTVDFDAKSARFAAELEKVQGSLKRLEGSAASLGRGLSLLQNVFNVAVVVAFAKAMFDAGDALGDAAARSGIAVESLSRLKFIADQSDVGFESLTVGIKKFQQGLSLASGGSASAAQNFAAIGVEVDKIRGLPLEQQLAAISEGFKNLRSPADQTRIAIDLFGKSGNELIPFLKLGSAGMKDLAAEADRLGITLTGSASAGISAADQALKKLKATIAGGFQNALGNIALLIVGTDGLSQMDKLTVRVSSLKEQMAGLEAIGPSPMLTKVREELALLEPQLKLLQTVASLSLPESKPGQGRRGGGGNPNSMSGIGGEFIPKGPTGAVDIGQLFDPQQRAEQAALIAEQATQAREQDFSEFLQFEFLKRQATDETYKAQLAMADAAHAAEQAMRQQTFDLSLGFLNALAGKSKAAAIAAVLLSKGQAIAQTIQFGAAAQMRALAELGPIAGAPVAAGIRALTAVNVGIIAATGALEIGNIAGGNAGGVGGTTLGTPSNPLPTTNADAVGATSRGSTTIIFEGPVAGAQAFIDLIRQEIDRDVVIIPPNSRQAAEIRGGI